MSLTSTPIPIATEEIPAALLDLVRGDFPDLESGGLKHPLDDSSLFRLEQFVSTAKSKTGNPALSGMATLLYHDALSRRVTRPSWDMVSSDLATQISVTIKKELGGLEARLSQRISSIEKTLGSIDKRLSSAEEKLTTVAAGNMQTYQKMVQVMNHARSRDSGYDGRLASVPSTSPRQSSHPSGVLATSRLLSSVDVVASLPGNDVRAWLKFYAVPLEGNLAQQRERLLRFLQGDL